MMLTLDALRDYGADTDTGVKRCAGKEDLYLKLVEKLRNDDSFSSLKDAVDNKDFEEAFRLAHKLKGSVSNLSLDPLLSPVERITESLRAKEDRDYSDDLKEMAEQKEKLDNL